MQNPFLKGWTEKETIYKKAIIRVIMQLPRGTFREIQKQQKLGDIFTELERGKFSGICSISCREGLGNLVLKSGKCILAEFETFKGDTALENLIYASSGDAVDAALSTLDEAQIQLSLEFNKAERIRNTGRGSTASDKPANPPVQQVHRTVEARARPAREPNMSLWGDKLPDKPLQPRKLPPQPPLATPTKPITEPPATIRARTISGSGRQSPIQETVQGESDMDTFDSMNLDEVTAKIREDCKTMVKNLQLEHLMERDR